MEVPQYRSDDLNQTGRVAGDSTETPKPAPIFDCTEDGVFPLRPGAVRDVAQDMFDRSAH